jgi:hypothetical protein
MFKQAYSAKDNISEKVTKNLTPQTKSRLKQVSLFLSENQVPRYIVYGIIAIKVITIYDKWRQLVAI